MSDPYEEILNGERLLRFPPRPRHDEILIRLRRRVSGSIATLTTARMQDTRSQVKISEKTILCPDMALVTTTGNKLWLVAEVISSDDHHADTVDKKMIYEEQRVPRLWIVDPRYDNVEVYHGTQFGLALKRVLSGRELLTESLLPGFEMPLHELFCGSATGEAGKYDF